MTDHSPIDLTAAIAVIAAITVMSWPSTVSLAWDCLTYLASLI